MAADPPQGFWVDGGGESRFYEQRTGAVERVSGLFQRAGQEGQQLCVCARARERLTHKHATCDCVVLFSDARNGVQGLSTKRHKIEVGAGPKQGGAGVGEGIGDGDGDEVAV